MNSPQVTQTDRDSLISPDDNRRMFDAIARRYDLMNKILSMGLDRRWRRKAVEVLAPCEGGRYLDIGCGTGDMGIEILRQCPGAEVLGIDPAENMLEIAVAKIAKHNLKDSISFQAGDAEAIGLEDASFTGAITAFCFRNIAERAMALSEMRRVLAPGGRLVILELTTPAHPLVRTGHRLYNRFLVPTAGRLIAGSKVAYQYLVHSVEDFPQPEEVAELLNAAGFVNVRARAVNGGIVTIFSGEVD